MPCPPYPHREQQPLKIISLSGGVATFPDDGRTGAELIKAADAATWYGDAEANPDLHPRS